ncbi:hypothetical protein AB0N31_05120 [Streptomyces sp. NPDC051051]|uniref:hypothetical protein n=1 Tax=Streptomyces sp. NPDC051051 TaxID=3155666 RepID=UPI00343F7859
MTRTCEAVAIGGGRSGLAAGGYHLRWPGLGFVVLDARATAGGARRHARDSPHLPGRGDWTGPASATLIGVGRPARDAARETAALLR